jgi:enoyl-CoA hydratase/carnithine racemase
MPSSIQLERRDAVALITLNRPEVLNAINVEMRETLIALLGELDGDATVRAIVIAGAGDRAFCSGQDLDETAKYTIADIDTWLTRQHSMYGAVRDLGKPCIAAFNGIAAGAGFQIGLCADLRVGFSEMQLGQPEIKAGLASIVGSYLMTLHLGLAQNTELSLTGDLISGQRAYELGLLNHLVPRERVLQHSLALATRLGTLPPTAMRTTKKSIRDRTQPGFEAALETAKRAQRQTYESGEPQAAMRKFLDGRSRKRN